VEHQDFKTLLDYHYWARDRVLDALKPLSQEQLTRDLGNSFRSIRDTVAHIYFAEWAWHERWNGRSPKAPLPLETYSDIASLRAAWSDLESNVRGVLDRFSQQAGGLKQVLEYKTLAGDPGASVFWHMLQHVVNHASYHRGQLTTMLRQLGATPPKSMDLIAFYRDPGKK
jgi:uncharacterized damage-inducible protein DinB